MDIKSLMNLQGMLFLLVAGGVILRKKKILPREGTAVLTDLVICVVLPCNIINSFFIQFNLSADGSKPDFYEIWQVRLIFYCAAISRK